MLTNWNPKLYEDKHSFVWKNGEKLLKLLSPQPKECILDLGCGTGQLTEEIARSGAEVIGIDSAAAMIETAQRNYPHLDFRIADATNFQVEKLLDAVFSNAVLHWISEPDAVLKCINQSLKIGGRFVAEFGGKGNVQAIIQALNTVLESFGYVNSYQLSPWYFPSIGQYATRLEEQNFEVIYAVLFERPTLLEGQESGMKNWLEMFANRLLKNLSPNQQIQVIEAVEKKLKPILYKDNNWTADYRRVQVVAIKR